MKELIIHSRNSKKTFTLVGIVNQNDLHFNMTVGVALMRGGDTFCKKTGRNFAKYRALKDPIQILKLGKTNLDKKYIYRKSYIILNDLSKQIQKNHKFWKSSVDKIDSEKYFELFNDITPEEKANNIKMSKEILLIHPPVDEKKRLKRQELKEMKKKFDSLEVVN